MRPKNIALIAIAALVLITGYMISTHAQEVGWDTNEEVERVQQEQWNEAEEGGQDLTEATGIPTPPRETKGEKELEKFEAVPTGYAKREYTIHQDNLAGQWQDANIFPVSNTEPKWPSLTEEQYEDALKTGIVDARLKSTIYEPYYSNMERICGTAPEAKQVHVRVAADSTKWRMNQSMQRPYTLYRELSFECLVKIK